MRLCFADTSYYLALLIPQDVNHEYAQRLVLRLRCPTVTSEFVILEIGNYLSGGTGRTKLGQFLQTLRADPYSTIVPVSTDMLERGLDLYLARGDKRWSLTDCTSFVILKEHGISDALTADRHFEQAGFTALLREPE